MSVHPPDVTTESGASVLTGQLWRVGGPGGAPTLALPGTVSARDADNDLVVASQTIAAEQEFSIPVPAGRYVLDARSPQIAGGHTACPAQHVNVPAGTRIRVDLYFAVR